MRQDFRHTIRLLRKSPGFTTVAILTLALSIGAITAVFSIIEAVLLRPLPYKDSRRLVAVWDKGIHEQGLAKIFSSFADFQEFHAHAHSFEQIAAATWAVKAPILTGHGPARLVMAVPVSAAFFSLLGVTPARGRTFQPDDLKRGCSVVVSDRF